jgi:hypothetical protein
MRNILKSTELELVITTPTIAGQPDLEGDTVCHQMPYWGYFSLLVMFIIVNIFAHLINIRLLCPCSQDVIPRPYLEETNKCASILDTLGVWPHQMNIGSNHMIEQVKRFVYLANFSSLYQRLSKQVKKRHRYCVSKVKCTLLIGF